MRSLAILLFALLASCGSSDPGETIPSPSREEQAERAVSPDGTTRLIDAGREPRTMLRYRVASGTRERMRLVMNMKMRMDHMGTRVSLEMPMELFQDVEVVEPETPGDIHYRFNITGVRLLDGFSSSVGEALPREQIETSLQGIVGISGESVISDRGIVRSLELRAPESADASLASTIDSLRSTLNNTFMALPEEPIGVGARWEIQSRITTGNQIVTDQISRFALDSVNEAGVIAISNEVDQRAERQRLNLPNVPEGIVAEIIELRSQGEGTSSLRLDRLTPEMRMRIANHTVSQVTAGEERERSTIDLEIDMSVGGVN